MKMKAWMFILILVPSIASADKWTGPDKELHAAGSALMAAGGYILFKPHMSKKKACGWAFGLSLAVGAAKEGWDSTKVNHEASYKDFAADALGAGLALAPECFKMKWSF